MRVLFIPCWWDGLPRDSGSAQIRAEWVCRYWDEAEVFDGSQRLKGVDLLVFQKTYLIGKTQDWIRAAARWRDDRRCRLAFDLCDPDFLEPEHERRMLTMLPLFDFAVGSTAPLTAWLGHWLPAYHIPDRLDMQMIDQIGATARYRPGRPVVGWAGYSHNWVQLEDQVREWIRRAGLNLNVQIHERPVPFAEFWRDVLEFDVLLNPRPDRPPFSFKSDNKTLMARALGLPVARCYHDLIQLCDPDERYNQGLARMAETRLEHDVRLSVQRWASLTDEWRFFRD